MAARTPCSDRRPTGHNRRLVVVEGMPGAGKTTAAATLVAAGCQVIGEYVRPAGDTVPVESNPATVDDDAHQANWLLKHRLATTTELDGTVYCDRDWLTAIAYAASLDDDGALLAQRSKWAIAHLAAGRLAVANHYVVVHIDTTTSLTRRARRLPAGHPWNQPGTLERLARFYADPVGAVANPLRALLARARWHHLQQPAPPTLVAYLMDLAGP